MIERLWKIIQNKKKNVLNEKTFIMLFPNSIEAKKEITVH